MGPLQVLHGGNQEATGATGRITDCLGRLDVEHFEVLWYFPECKIAIISTRYAYMSMS